MRQPVAIFGEVEEGFNNEIISFRKRIKELGFDFGKSYVDTVLHITFAVNTNFEGDPLLLKKLIEQLKVRIFKIHIKGLIIIDNNIALQFDNSFTKTLSENITNNLIEFNFESVDTDFMKLIRSEVKSEHLEEVKNMLDILIPKTLSVNKISAAGKELRKEDILWTVSLV